MTQHLGSRSRILFYEESVYETDPGAPVGYVLPLNQKSGFGGRRRGIQVPIWKGGRQPFSMIPGPHETDGPLQLGLEYRTVGRILKVMQGGTAGAPIATGTGYLHYIPLNSSLTPTSCQIQKEYMDGTPLYFREKGVRIGSMGFRFDPDGVCTYSLNAMGTGRRVQTDLAGTKTDDGYTGQSYYNGFLEIAGTSQAGITTYEFNLGNGLQRQAVAFRNGLAGSINPGIFTAAGRLGMMLEDLTFFNQAVAQSLLRLEMMWGNNTMSALDQFFWIIAPQTRFMEDDPDVGGEEGHTIESDFGCENADSSATGANALEAFVFSNKGPWTIPSPSNLGFIVNGGAPVVKALTPGAGRTAANIVTDLLASGGITGATSVGFPKDALGDFSRFMVKTTAKGVAATLQVDTGTANSAHALLGLDGVSRTGKAPTAVHAFLLNDLSATY